MYIVTDLLRQRLCKRGNYATVEESVVFRAVSVAPLPLLRSAGVNTSLVARQQLQTLSWRKTGDGSRDLHAFRSDAMRFRSNAAIGQLWSRVY
jgi:hypothetical protein